MVTHLLKAAEGRGAGEDCDSLSPSMQVHPVQAAGLGSLGRFPREVANTHARSHCKMQHIFCCKDTTQFLYTRCSQVLLVPLVTDVWRKLQLWAELPKLSPAWDGCGRKASFLSPSFTALLHWEGRTKARRRQQQQCSQSIIQYKNAWKCILPQQR